jgi:hypothetical protein
MFCYNIQNLVKMITQMPPLLTWHICLIIIKFSSLVVTTCALNQSRGHWLLIYAFNSSISISLKLETEPENAPSL